MIDDEALYAKWLAASREAKQPQCHYPQFATLRAFARAIWFEGCASPNVTDGHMTPECPY
jgi:hypothetical protein